MMTYTPPHLLDGARWAGMRVGLLGGSFNPPHEGHLHVSRTALNSLGLDCVWWLVTPQNPLKTTKGLRPYDERLEASRTLTRHTPQVVVSDIERSLGTTKSYDTIRALRSSFPATQFVWVTGMDIALEFHRWHRWREILDLVATAHIARPPAETMAVSCPLRQLSSQRHICPDSSVHADLAPGHTYWVLRAPTIDMSSTILRKGI